MDVKNTAVSTHQDTYLKVGQLWEQEGGYYAGIIARPDKSVYALIVPPRLGGSAVLPLTTLNHINERCPETSLFDGMQNTYLYNEHAFPAFQWASNLRLHGKNDWYIFSKEEMEIAMRCNELLPAEDRFIHNREYWTSSWFHEANAYTQMLFETPTPSASGGYLGYSLELVTGVYFDFGGLDVRAGRHVRLF